MINHHHLMRFLTKEDIKLSVEEFLFLYNVRFHTEETHQVEELKDYIKLYYTQNQFYGRDLFPKEEAKSHDWNILINKLVKQGYLLDYRVDKTSLKIKEFEITPEFNDKIFSNDIEAYWNEVEDIITTKVGRKIIIGNNTLEIFRLTNNFKSLEDMKKFLWNTICSGGNKYHLTEFIIHLEWFLDNRGLNVSFANFLVNYGKGTLKKDIEEDMKETYNKNIYRR